MTGVDLPLIDVHRVRASAPPDVVWSALTRRFRGSNPAFTRYLRLISAEPAAEKGAVPDVGAAVPGFEVVAAVPGERLELAGGHRFSRYRLVFDLEPDGAATVLTATTYATFPGFLGGLYKAAVIHSPAHRFVTRKMLESVKARAER